MKSRFLCLLLAVGLSLALVHCVNAQTQPVTPADSLSQRVTQLAERVNELEYRLEALHSGSVSQLITGEELIAGRGGAVYLPMRGQPVLPPEITPAAGLESDLADIDEPRLEISGFFDGVAEFNPADNSQASAALNQVEIDIARGLGRRGEVFLAVVFDESFGVGAATVSYHLIARNAAEGRPTPALESWTMTAGQFDVPFGLDCGRYASIDRPTITPPVVCAATHNGWNDVGLQSGVGGRYGGLDVYAVRGLETTIWNDADEIPPDVAADDERWLTIKPNFSGGARLRFVPVPGLECGGSAARGYHSDSRTAFTLTGLHARSEWGALALQAEAIRGRYAEAHAPFTVRGWYLEGLYDLGRCYTTARFDNLKDSDVTTGRSYSVGAGVRIVENLQCRMEYVLAAESTNNRLLFQIAAAF